MAIFVLKYMGKRQHDDCYDIIEASGDKLEIENILTNYHADELAQMAGHVTTQWLILDVGIEALKTESYDYGILYDEIVHVDAIASCDGRAGD